MLYVYTWDLALVILALLVHAGPVRRGRRRAARASRRCPFAAQVIEAVSSAAFAATLIILAALLTRRHAWVRIVQIGTLGDPHHARAIIGDRAGALTGTAPTSSRCSGRCFFVLLDGLAILVMTDRRVVSWYDERGARSPSTCGRRWCSGSPAAALNIVVDAVFR